MASFTVPCPKSSALPLFKGSPHQTQQQFPRISFQSRNAYSPSSSYVDNQNALFRFQGPMQTQPTIWKVHSQISDVAEKSSNSAPVIEANLGNSSSGGKDEPQEGSVAQNRVPDAVSISAFMTQVADLVKLVDSRDIVELHLKQLDCEVTIRKKEALPQASTPAPVVMMQPHQYQAAPSYPPPATPSAAPTSASPAPSAAALPAPGKTSSSSHPPLKCPMAGTFYRCAAPGEPPFVKVGDKVQKGQVVCIIEAMKLMNEIEADQSGTVVEILVEDGKPVSVDMPLFVIEP